MEKPRSLCLGARPGSARTGDSLSAKSRSLLTAIVNEHNPLSKSSILQDHVGGCKGKPKPQWLLSMNRESFQQREIFVDRSGINPLALVMRNENRVGDLESPDLRNEGIAGSKLAKDVATISCILSRITRKAPRNRYRRIKNKRRCH